MIHTLYISLFLALCGSLTAQREITFDQIKPIFDRIERYYKGDYAIWSEITSYKGHTSTQPEDRSTGYIYKKGSVIEAIKLGIYSIQDSRIKIIVDSSEAMVGLTYPDTAHLVSFDQYKAQQAAQIIERITLAESDRFIQLEFHYKKGGEYENISLRIVSSGMIEEMTLFFANEIAYKGTNGTLKKDKAKVQMKFKEIPLREAKFAHKISDIIIPQGQSYALTNAYKSFELIEFRYQP
jgi:hypothetical protein